MLGSVMMQLFFLPGRIMDRGFLRCYWEAFLGGRLGTMVGGGDVDVSVY